MRIGIVGLANSGKTTVFNALTGAGYEAGEYPFSTQQCIEASSPPVGGRSVVVIDTPGLCRGSAVGEGLGNAFLREVLDAGAIVQVIRAFDRGLAAGAYPEVQVDPFGDAMTLDAELALADVGLIHEWIKGPECGRDQVDALRAILSAIEHGQSARSMGLAAQELLEITKVPLLTAKPLILVVNVNEEDTYDVSRLPFCEELLQKASISDTPVIIVCAKLEEDARGLCELDLGDEPNIGLAEELTGEPCLLTRVLNVCETLGLFPD